MTDKSPYTTLPRLWVTEDLAAQAPLTAPTEQAHYLQHVLRLKPGDNLRLFNGRDGEWRGQIASLAKKSLTIVLQERLHPQPAAPTGPILCAAPIKKTHFDYMVEKATELGIQAFRPMLTERTQIREVNLERLRSIAIEAAEQSERLDLPEILPLAKLPDLAAHWPRDVLPVICAEWGEAQPAAAAFAKLSATKVALFTGPEGGFAAAELDVLRRLPGAVFVRLGPRILRADTAAIAALSCWQAIRGDWRA